MSDTFLCKHSPRRTGNIQNAVKKLQGINCCMRRTSSQGIPVNMKVAVVVCALGLLASCVGGTSQCPCLEHAVSSVAFLFIDRSIRTMGFSALQACRGPWLSTSCTVPHSRLASLSVSMSMRHVHFASDGAGVLPRALISVASSVGDTLAGLSGAASEPVLIAGRACSCNGAQRGSTCPGSH